MRTLAPPGATHAQPREGTQPTPPRGLGQRRDGLGELWRQPPGLSRAGKPATFRQMSQVIANGESMEADLPCSLEAFLVKCGLPPRSVVVEHNGEAVSPSEFPTRPLADGDRIWIARISSGG